MLKKGSILEAYFVIVALVFIMCSGSCIGIVQAKSYDTIYVLLSFLLYGMCRKRIDGVKMAILFVFIALYILNYMVNRQASANPNAYVSYILRMVGTFFICVSIDQETFEKWYMRLIVIISAASLVTYAIGIMHDMSGKITMMSTFKMFGPFNFNGIAQKRNSGIFWEPGAFQLFLMYALFIGMKRSGWSIAIKKKNIFKNLEIAILLVTILTTNSTTGYIALAGFMVYFMYINWYSMSTTMRTVLFIPIIVILIFGIRTIIQSNTVMDKFSDTNLSYSTRMNHFSSSLEIIKDKLPLIGYGFGTTSLKEVYSSYGMKLNSVGIFSVSISMGLIYAGAYTGFFIHNIMKQKDRIILLIIFGLSMVTESFYQYPIYFIWLFGFEWLTSDTRERKSQRMRMR